MWRLWGRAKARARAAFYHERGHAVGTPRGIVALSFAHNQASLQARLCTRRSLAALSVGRLARAPADTRPPIEATGEGSAGDMDTEIGKHNEEDVKEQNDQGARPPGDLFEEIGPELWPFLSPVDEALSNTTAGEGWPMGKGTHMRGQRMAEQLGGGLSSEVLEPLDLALLARAVASLPEGPDREDASARLQMESVEEAIPECPPGVLASIVSGLSAPPVIDGCGRLVRLAAAELQRRPSLRPRHAAVLLAAVGRSGSHALPKVPMLRVAEESFANAGRGERLECEELVLALEGLARLRCAPLDHAVEEMLAAVAVALAARLAGDSAGAAMGRMLVGPGPGITAHEQRALAIRLLAALWTLPEATSHAVAWFASLRGYRFLKELPPSLNDEMVASAACTLARCGVWEAANCGLLLSWAIKRHNLALKGANADPTLSPAACASWLCAVAQAGVGLEDGTRNVAYSDALISGAQALLTDDTALITSSARALWALHAMDKIGEGDGLGQKLWDFIAAATPSSLSAEAWALLREVRASDAANSGADGEEAREAEGEDAAFGSASWKDGFEHAAALENLHYARVGRAKELRMALERASAFLEEPIGDVQEGHIVGPYHVAALVGSHGVAIDFDVVQSPVNRALRRQQWSSLAPDVRVAEVTLAQWDALCDTQRAALVQRRVEGVDDPVDGEDEDDD
mmetsp:Transcript_57830/g.161410  ORF Transcript_57830/g.161410 Transcript_57830/m.161410 type:complete len:691 (+) Transcript_57830:59-2131(+)